MSAARLELIITEVKKELVSAQKKAKFFRNQYRKHKPNSPDLAASIKVLRESTVEKVVSVKKEIRDLTKLLKRYAELEAKKLKL